MSVPISKLKKHQINRSDEDDGFVESILNSDEDKQRNKPTERVLEPVNETRQQDVCRHSPRSSPSSNSSRSPLISPTLPRHQGRESYATSNCQDPSGFRRQTYDPSEQSKEKIERQESYKGNCRPCPQLQRNPDLLHPNKYQPQINFQPPEKEGESSGLQKPASSYFGSLLEVPPAHRAGLPSRSASPSTDEGIGAEELTHEATVNYFQNGEGMEEIEYPGLVGVPGVFCACCYNTATGKLVRATIPATMQPSSFMQDQQRRSLLRMKSEEIPRTQAPNSIKWALPAEREGHLNKSKQRQKFEHRGHSISDAQVRYRPASTEFLGIKQYKNRRKLPDVPKKTFTRNHTLSNADSPPEQGTETNGKHLDVQAKKPPLRRQHRHCIDSSEDVPEKESSPNMSVPFLSYQEKSAFQFDEVAVDKIQNFSPNNKEQKILVDQENNNDFNDNDASMKRKPMDSYVFVRKNDRSPGISLLKMQANSFDCPRKSPNRTNQFFKSVDQDFQRDKSNRKLVNDDSDKKENMSVPREDNLPCMDFTTNMDDNVKGENSSSCSNETSSKPTSAEVRKSLTERLMAVTPSDQKRVESIVQDILFEMGEERILQYKSAFAKFDKDSSGIISSKQLRRLLRTLGHNPGDDELRELVNQVDMDENGKIDFNEFIIMIGYFDKANNTSEDLSHIFRVFDEAKGGSIDVSELRNICSEYLVESVPLEKINEMIEFVDIDGDGEIDRDELCRVWSNRW